MKCEVKLVRIEDEEEIFLIDSIENEEHKFTFTHAAAAQAFLPTIPVSANEKYRKFIIYETLTKNVS